ncbi:MAG: hypothetical protein JWM53_6931, partial [bacterium]|nr:hypothetical protein [bacterium]
MRAILPLLLMTAACGSKGGNVFEYDIAVNAPGAASVVIDGTQTLAPVGGVYSRGFPSVSAASSLRGTVATVNSDGSVRSTAPYEFGAYCASSMPLLRQTMRFVEALDGSG